MHHLLVRVRLDRKATAISLLVVLGVRQDGQKVLLAVKNMGGESEAAWRALLDDLTARGLKTPEFVIVDGAPGLEKVLATLVATPPNQLFFCDKSFPDNSRLLIGIGAR